MKVPPMANGLARQRLFGWLLRGARVLRMVGEGLADRYHPILAQIVPIRRCNLACAYCNEYDKTSEPVPLPSMLRRIDRLAALRTACVTLSGGEPMLHPELDTILAHIRGHGMITGLITNGFYLSPDRIRRLNAAGLEYLQLSIDNVNPDNISQKSLKTLDRKLQHLAAHARFHVNINSVIGAGGRNVQDPLIIARRARQFGFSTSIGVIHDESGQLRPLGPAEAAIYEQVLRLGQGLYTRINDFQHNLIEGRPNHWQCRAGARYLYVCEDGLVHYCSQQRGYPAIPLERYTVQEIRRAFHTEKPCAPYCTIGCVHRVSVLDARVPISPSRLLRRLPAAAARMAAEVQRP